MPGLLLIYFIYSIWENLKKIKGIKISLKGSTAVAGGLITVAAIILMQKSGFALDNILILLLTVVLLFTRKIVVEYISSRLKRCGVFSEIFNANALEAINSCIGRNWLMLTTFNCKLDIEEGIESWKGKITKVNEVISLS